MGEMSYLLTAEQEALWLQHKYRVCGDDCQYCADEDCPDVPEGDEDENVFLENIE